MLASPSFPHPSVLPLQCKHMSLPLHPHCHHCSIRPHYFSLVLLQQSLNWPWMLTFVHDLPCTCHCAFLHLYSTPFSHCHQVPTSVRNWVRPLYAYSHFILATSLLGIYYHCHHFTEEKTKAQRKASIICSRTNNSSFKVNCRSTRFQSPCFSHCTELCPFFYHYYVFSIMSIFFH